MHKRTVTSVAIAGLVLVMAVAYVLNNRNAGANAAVGKAPAVQPAVKGDGKAEPAKAPAAGVPVEVIVLEPSRVVEDLGAVGTLRANESVQLRTEVTGRVERIGFRDGQPVKKGQLLIGLDAALNEAEVAQARAELALAQTNLKRTEDLAKKNFVSGSAQDQAESNVAVLQARLQLAQARLSKMRIVAPFDGVVGIRAVSIGDVVRDGTDLVNLEDIKTLKVDFRVPERLFTQLKVGQPMEVVADALPGARYTGRVDAINPRIDASGRSLEVRAALDNTDGRLRPGMFVRVRVILGDRAAALMVPEEAIVPQGERFYVFRVADGKAQRVPVRLGVRREGQVELMEGVRAGDRVVTAGIRVQRDGQPVRVLNEVKGQPVVGSGETDKAAPAAPADPAGKKVAATEK